MTIHKKQRKILLFGFSCAILIGAVFAFLINHFASADSVKRLTINSNANFENREEGAWKIDETAKVLAQNKIQVKYDVDSILKGDGKKKDIFIMTDISGSMTGARISQHIAAYKNILPTLIVDGNRVAMGTFSDHASLYRDFTSEAHAYDWMEGFPATGGGTSYYQAFKLLNDFFADYTPAENTSLIILFLTDGVPFEDTPSEIAEYQDFKNRHPYAVVQGIQYELGDTVIPGIRSISDNQFVSNTDNFEDVLFEAAMDGYKYSEFRLENQINSDYYSVDSVEATMGEAEASGDTVLWTMDNKYRSGTKQSLTVNLTVKDECFALNDARCKVNNRSIVTSKIEGANNDNVNTTDSVIIQFKYDVSYDLNAPTSCTTDASSVPATTKQIIFSTVGIDSYAPSCDGYTFKAWTIANDDATRMNDDYFRMPEGDVVIRALWAKPSISKTMDGSIAPTTTAMLAAGRTIGWQNSDYRNVENLKYTDTLPVDFTPSASNTISTQDSELPVYTWYDSTTKTAYFYSDADIIYMNPNSSSFLYGMSNLKDISDLAKLNASKVENLYYAFSTLGSSADLSAFANWDTSSLKYMNSTFRGMQICDLTPLAKWDVSNVVDMTGLFGARPSGCTTLEGLEDWDVSSVTTMAEMFVAGYTEDLSALKDWQTSSLTSMYGMFNSSNIKSVAPLAGWDVSHVTSMERTFSSTPYLSSLQGLEEWDTTSLVSLYDAFRSSGVSDISALAGWETPSLTILEQTFYGASNVASIASLAGWDVSHVTTLALFIEGTAVSSLSPLAGWDVSSVQTMYRAFQAPNLRSMDGVEEWTTTELTSLSRAFHPNIIDINALEEWDVRKVTDMAAMLAGSKVSSLRPLHKWKTNSLKTMTYFIQDAPNLTNFEGLDDWDVTKLEYAVEAFCRMPNVTTLEHLAEWDTVSLLDARGMFNYMTKLTNLHGLEDWPTGSFMSIDSMFYGDTNLENLNALSNWRLTSVNAIWSAFGNLPKITSLEPIRNLGLGTATSLDSMFYGDSGITDFEPISGWDVSNITSLDSTFVGTSETNLNDLSGWNVSKVNHIRKAFQNMSELTDISGLSSWNIPLLGNMEEAFANDVKVTSLNGIQSWGTTNLRYLGASFYNMTSLSDISALAGWNVSNVVRTSWTFYNDYSITSVEALRNWNVESIVDIKYIFQYCTGVSDFTPLNGWQINSSVNQWDRDAIFSGIDPADHTFPTWYNN